MRRNDVRPLPGLRSRRLGRQAFPRVVPGSGLVAAMLLVLAALARPAAAIEVTIETPANGDVVAGVVTIAGTAADLDGGFVSVSIDGGPFQIAGGEVWSVDWDTTDLADGPYQIRARARACLFCPPVFDIISVDLANGSLVSVSISAPADGAVVLDTFSVVGTSTNAVSVALSVDGGPFDAASGVDPWNVVFEPGSLAPGPHVLLARATGADGVQSTDTISIVVDEAPVGTQSITYLSSTDGAPLVGQLHLPVGFDPDGPAVPFVCYLHGAGGSGILPAELIALLDERGWIGLAPDGRQWALAEEGCSWNYSAAYVDSDDPSVGPGERDILDAIDWAIEALPVDVDRVHLMGFSFGGRGAYIIGLKHPDRFATIVPLGAPTDMYEIMVRRPVNCVCKQGITGGLPGDGPEVETMYTITSGRFLLENAYNLPVYHGHGLFDDVAANRMSNPDTPYWHGWHAVSEYWDGAYVTPGTVAGWNNECFTGTDDDLPLIFDFGHTPTLAELHARHPEAYDWAFMFTPVGHTRDPLWLTGAPASPERFGTPHPGDPSVLLGAGEFMADRSRVLDPDTVVYKTYTDVHRRAYWAAIDVTGPWSGDPGAIRATRTTGVNRLDAELVRVARMTVDLDQAGLALATGQPLTLELRPLVEPAFDPALAPGGEPATTIIRLEGDFGDVPGVRVRRDGVAIDPATILVGVDAIEFGPVDFSATTTVLVEAVLPADLDGDGVVGTADLLIVLAGWGTCAPPPAPCPADVDGDGEVGLVDLLAVIGAWTV